MSYTVADIREAYRDADGVVWEIALDERSEEAVHELVARAASGVELRVAVMGMVRDSAGTEWLRTRKPLLVGTQVETGNAPNNG